jgi:hypothetical protein
MTPCDIADISCIVTYQFFIFNKHICVWKKTSLLWFFIWVGVVIYITRAASVLDQFTCKHKAHIHMKGSITFRFKMDTQLRIWWITGYFPGINRTKREVHHRSPSSAGVKNGRRHASTPSTCFPAVDRDKFTSTFENEHNNTTVDIDIIRYSVIQGYSYWKSTTFIKPLRAIR